MSFEMNAKRTAAGILALSAVACSHMGPGPNATPQEQECHRIASAQKSTLRQGATNTAIGAGAGAVGGAVLPGVSTIGGALAGAVVTGTGQVLVDENRYKQAYDECMRSFNQNNGQSGTVVPGVQPSGTPAYTAPSGTYQPKRGPVAVPAPVR